jgi:hypothetical protein
MSGATSALPAEKDERANGIAFTYFTGDDDFVRPMWPLPEGVAPGTLVWADGHLAAPDASGREQMLAHYAHLRALDQPLEHGLGVWDPEKEEFRRVRKLPNAETWRFPKGHPVRGRGALADYFLFRATREDHAPFPAVRALATCEALMEPESYEAFTCLGAGTEEVERDEAGAAVWGWKRGARPLTQSGEAQLIRAGKLRAEEARYQVRDLETREPVRLHAGSVCWNDFRRSWGLIAGEAGNGRLGEIWFAEAPEPTGPWLWARKIVTHDRYSFYNPVQHAFLDQQGGRFIHFEGTYVTTFSDAPAPTPRYDYNQILYQLDLADPRLPQPLHPLP